MARFAPERTILPRLQLSVRLLLAAIFVSYGIAKLLGTQFIRSGSTIDQPLSDLYKLRTGWTNRLHPSRERLGHVGPPR